jgi:hypothetical protein
LRVWSRELFIGFKGGSQRCYWRKRLTLPIEFTLFKTIAKTEEYFYDGAIGAQWVVQTH